MSDALIVHSHQATSEASAFYGLFLMPNNVCHNSSSSALSFVEIHLDLPSCPLKMNSLCYYEIPHSPVIFLLLLPFVQHILNIHREAFFFSPCSSCTESGCAESRNVSVASFLTWPCIGELAFQYLNCSHLPSLLLFLSQTSQTYEWGNCILLRLESKWQ